MSAANSNIQLTELDFDNIKNNLKNYLRDQDILKDADYEGSVLSTVLDVLSYNTHYNAVMAHLVANEAFLDSAVKRNSVVSIAKTMGYIPRSARASRAVIDFTVKPDPAYTSNTLYIPRTTQFTTSVDGKSYVFTPATDLTISILLIL